MSTTSIPLQSSFFYGTVLGGCRGDFDANLNKNANAHANLSRVLVGGLPALSVPAQLGDYLDVVVACPISADKIYCQLKNETATITDLSEKLQKKYGGVIDGEPLINPSRGQLCAARYAMDRRFYRAAVITRPDPMDIEVFFIDYGNMEVVPKSDVCVLADAFLQIPPQAVRIHLRTSHAQQTAPKWQHVCTLIENRSVCVRLEGNTFVSYAVSMVVPDGGKHFDVGQIAAGLLPIPQHEQPSGSAPKIAPSITAKAENNGGGDSKYGFGENAARSMGFKGGAGGFDDQRRGGNDGGFTTSGNGFGGGSARQNGKGGRGCFNCGEEGHMARDCSKPRTDSRQTPRAPRACFKCQEDGHISRDCPKSVSDSFEGGQKSGAGSGGTFVNEARSVSAPFTDVGGENWDEGPIVKQMEELPSPDIGKNAAVASTQRSSDKCEGAWDEESSATSEKDAVETQRSALKDEITTVEPDSTTLPMTTTEMNAADIDLLDFDSVAVTPDQSNVMPESDELIDELMAM